MANVFAAIGKVFKKIGKALATAFKVIDRLVPEEQMLAGLAFVEQAALNFAGNDTRRAWVVEQLRAKFSISESVARLITELAVSTAKHKIGQAFDEIEEEVTPDAA